MKRTFLLIAALLATATVASDIHASVRAQFEAFKAKFNKQYPNKEAESKRFQIFVSNMIKAKKMHELNPLASFGVNEYSDLSEQEFTRYHNAREHYARRPRTNPEPLPLKSSAGEKIDWRAKGAVTAVKNQGQCGSCWAFSATGNIEGQHFIKHGQLVSLSEQELVSCDTLCDACQGGLMDYAFEWLVSSRGGNIFTEASYPYASGNGNSPSCKLTGHTVGAKISGHRDIAHSETAIANEVYSNGPVSIGVDATSWQTYNGGILTNCISSQVDHGVLAVGFDDTHSPAYWIIKNSWGASWGEEGYIRVAKGSNQCLIDYAPSTSISA